MLTIGDWPPEDHEGLWARVYLPVGSGFAAMYDETGKWSVYHRSGRLLAEGQAAVHEGCRQAADSALRDHGLLRENET